MQFGVFAGAQLCDAGCDLFRVRLQFRPTGKWQDEDRQFATGEILLKSKRLISRDQYIELAFGGIDQLSIGKR